MDASFDTARDAHLPATPHGDSAGLAVHAPTVDMPHGGGAGWLSMPAERSEATVELATDHPELASRRVGTSARSQTWSPAWTASERVGCRAHLDPPRHVRFIGFQSECPPSDASSSPVGRMGSPPPPPPPPLPSLPFPSLHLGYIGWDQHTTNLLCASPHT